MEKILIRYKGNESVRYNGKEFAVSIFKIPRSNFNCASGPFHAGEAVTVTTNFTQMIVDSET